jgi:hypothetical protein
MPTRKRSSQVIQAAESSPPPNLSAAKRLRASLERTGTATQFDEHFYIQEEEDERENDMDRSFESFAACDDDPTHHYEYDAVWNEFHACTDDPLRKQMVQFVLRKRAQLEHTRYQGQTDLLILSGDLDANSGSVNTLKRLVQLSHDKFGSASSTFVDHCMLHITVGGAGGDQPLSTFPRLVVDQLQQTTSSDELLWIVLDMRRASQATITAWMSSVRRIVQQRMVGCSNFVLPASKHVQVVLLLDASLTKPQPVSVTQTSGLTIGSPWTDIKRAHYQHEALTYALNFTLKESDDEAAPTYLNTNKTISLWLCRPLLEQDRLKAVQQLVYAFFCPRLVDNTIVDFLLRAWSDCIAELPSSSSSSPVHLTDLWRVLSDLMQNIFRFGSMLNSPELIIRAKHSLLSGCTLVSITSAMVRY